MHKINILKILGGIIPVPKKVVRYDSECCTEERRKCREEVQNNGIFNIQRKFRCFSTCFSFERRFRKVLNQRECTSSRNSHRKFIKNRTNGIYHFRTINQSCCTKLLVLLRHACGGCNHLLTGVVA